MSPLNPIYDEQGKIIYNLKYIYAIDDGTALASPFAMNTLNTLRNQAYHGLGKVYAEAGFLRYFTLTSAAGFDFMLNENKIKNYPQLMISDPWGISSTGKLEQNTRRTTDIVFTNSLLFHRPILNHSVTLLLGQEVQKNNQTGLSLKMGDISTNPTREDVAGEGFQQSGKQNRLSYFSQLKYAYKNRYYLEASLRADGASNFGTSNRYGTFWSVGGAYLLSEEPFFKNAIPGVNFLKFRGSAGPAGNSAAILDSYRLTELTQGTFLGNPMVRDFVGGNAGVKWEQTFSWNAGVEFRLFNNRLSVTTDIYKRKTKNFIAQVLMASTGGYNEYFANIGDIRNSGLELSVFAQVVQSRNFSWSITANWSRNSNKLTKSYYPETAMGGTINKVGEEYNSYYGPVWNGVNTQTGRPQWLDSSKNFTDDYSRAPFQIMGKAQPDGTGSVIHAFSYKEFSLSAMLYYSYGSTISGRPELQNDGLFPYVNQSIAALNHWRNPGDNSPNPRRLFRSGFGGVREDVGTYPSSRYYFDGDFIRLSNVQLGYRFPALLLKKWHVESLRVFVQASNLALWTKYSGSDPENINAFGGAGVLYPQARTYSLGIDVSF
jgi:TonB-linked SusC/RagA family outer membrane protein